MFSLPSSLLDSQQFFLWHMSSPQMASLPLALPPQPPFITPPPPEKQTRPSSLLKQISTPKQVENQHLLTQKVSSYSYNNKTRDHPKLYRPRRTNPIIWCASVFCLVFSLLLIFLGIATLIIFVGIKPRRPVFDISSASLSVVYVNSPGHGALFSWQFNSSSSSPTFHPKASRDAVGISSHVIKPRLFATQSCYWAPEAGAE